MKRILSLLTSVAILSLVFIFASSRESSQVSAADNAIVSRDAEVEGVKLHYMTAGHGPAVILLHGYAETSLMWKPIIPLLAERFTVIAPDLPGNWGLGYSGRWSRHEDGGNPNSRAGPLARCAESRSRRP